MPSFLTQLVGNWDLVSYTATNIEDDQDVVYPMGKTGKGRIMYTADGYMAALLQCDDVMPYKADWMHGTMSELADAAEKTMSYCGPFYLEERPGNRQKILHHAKISLPPNWLNTFQLRLAEMTREGGQLFLTLGPQEPMEMEGVKRTLRLRWRKAARNEPSNVPPEAKV